MIKVSLFLTRRSDLTREQFSDHWMNKHWPVVQTVPEVMEATRHYVQLHNVDGLPSAVTPAPYDGVAEVWFDNKEAAVKVMTSKDWATIVGEDDKLFLDTSKTVAMFSEERIDYRPL